MKASKRRQRRLEQKLRDRGFVVATEFGPRKSTLNRMSKRERIESQGYVVNDDGTLEHRLVCRNAHGKYPASWHVHHINFSRSDNRPENLIAMPAIVHHAIHKEMAQTNVQLGREEILKRIDLHVQRLNALKAKRKLLLGELKKVDRSLKEIGVNPKTVRIK